ncbi:MAG: hypothetical protein ABJZ55_20475 [Fuerstiella sp.]
MMSSWFTLHEQSAVYFPFVQMDGVPEASYREYREVSRPGIDSVGHYVGGTKGKIFTVKTSVDSPNLATAKTQQAAYRAAEGGLLDLYWQSVFFGTVFVYEAKPELVDVLGASAGGLNNGLAACCATWKLRVVT